MKKGKKKNDDSKHKRKKSDKTISKNKRQNTRSAIGTSKVISKHGSKRYSAKKKQPTIKELMKEISKLKKQVKKDTRIKKQLQNRISKPAKRPRDKKKKEIKMPVVLFYKPEKVRGEKSTKKKYDHWLVEFEAIRFRGSHSKDIERFIREIAVKPKMTANEFKKRHLQSIIEWEMSVFEKISKDTNDGVVWGNWQVYYFHKGVETKREDIEDEDIEDE